MARTQTLSVKELELSAGINTEFTDKSQFIVHHNDAPNLDFRYGSGVYDKSAPHGAESMNNADTEQINDAMTDVELFGQYMLSDIQRAQLESLYESLSKHKSQSFRLTPRESNELTKLINSIIHIHIARQWQSPEDRMVHPRFRYESGLDDNPAQGDCKQSSTTPHNTVHTEKADQPEAPHNTYDWGAENSAWDEAW